MEFDIQKRTFLVPVDSRIYLLAKKQAEEDFEKRLDKSEKEFSLESDGN